MLVVLPEPCRPVISTTEGSFVEVQAHRSAAAEHRHHLVAHDAEHGLVRREAPEHVLADRALAHPLQELLHHLEVDVGLEQRETDLAQRNVDVGRRERTAAPEGAEHALQPVTQRVEHVGPLLRRPHANTSPHRHRVPREMAARSALRRERRPPRAHTRGGK